MNGLSIGTSSSRDGAHQNQASDRYRCFDLPFGRSQTKPAWFNRWRRAFSEQSLAITSSQEEALARLLPALLCGEQSAIAVFHAEALRLSQAARSASLAVFSAIEADEYAHEASLQTLANTLPTAADGTAIRRRSQLFFGRLGRIESVAHHFAQVAQLDSATCAVMWYLQHSSVGGDSMLGTLAERIKRDEARHVSISRKYAFALGIARNEYRTLGQAIRADLTCLLRHVADSFDAIGIDPDRLFDKINRGVA